MRRLTAVFLTIAMGFGGAAAQADCVGRNLMPQLPAATRAAIEDAAERVPYAEGIEWIARRDGAALVLLGTYHFSDRRHARTLARFDKVIGGAEILLVEAGPKEEAQLTSALTQQPELIFDTKAKPLPERLTAEEWQALSEALEARGVPAIMASQMRPWYVAMLLGVSPCMMREAAADGGVNGLDRQLIDSADDKGVSVRALEPWDTVLDLFADLTPEEELDMIRSALPAARHADDYAATLAEAYFAGDVWAIWEFGRFDAYANSGLSRAEVDEQLRLARDLLMDQRNAAWIPRLERGARDAQREGKAAVAAFGALHLPGENGVLRLLEKRGWEISPVE